METGSALISVPVSSFLSARCWIASPVLGWDWMSVVVPASVPVDCVPAEAVEGSERCWMMVLFTANLYLGDSVEASEGVLSEMRDCRILLMMVLFQLAVASCE